MSNEYRARAAEALRTWIPFLRDLADAENDPALIKAAAKVAEAVELIEGDNDNA